MEPWQQELLNRARAERQPRLMCQCCGEAVETELYLDLEPFGIRAAACSEHFSAKYTRLHNNSNILCLGGRVIGVGTAIELVDLFVDTEFEGGRHQKESTKSMPLKNKAMNILFDLDGTITDPMLGITNSVMYALKRYGIVVEDRRELYKFIGPPLAESFSRYYGFSESEGYELVKVYREFFSDKGLYENEVYEGIEDMLKTLKDEGHKIYLATSKPQVFMDHIAKTCDLRKFFDVIVGADADKLDSGKKDIIEKAFNSLRPQGCEKPLMVGDTKYDILGAKNADVPSVAVTFGFGSIDEMIVAGATYVAKNCEDIKKIVLE